MKHRLILPLILATTAVAQPATTATPNAGAAAPAAPITADMITALTQRDPDLLAAKPGERVLLPKLLGVRLLANADQLHDPGFPTTGVDATHLPWVDRLTFAPFPPKFLNKPASRDSLHRIEMALRAYAGLRGHSFVTVYIPPQDITEGYVQIVISEAKADTRIGINGAHYFSEQTYRSALRQRPGEPVNKPQLDEDVAWLNRNPYHQVQVSAASGSAANSTALDLEVQERIPFGLSAGYNNTGTKNTDENRVSAGVTWANALGRGDQMSYQFIADPHLEHSKTNAGTYTAFLPWRHIATFSASYTTLDTIMAPPFTQKGTSWQTGLRYEIPLGALRPGWSQSLSVSADLKYSDNNLEFAAVPITNNPTEFAEFGATYGVSFKQFGGLNSITLTGEASPGGLVSHDNDRAFNGSRFGAKAQFAYATLSLSHSHPLLYGFTWNLSVNAQVSSGALLGSEQLNGGGSGAVRGYAESTAFGDYGAVISNELHAPGFSLFRGHDNVDLFGFFDVASLNLHVDNESTDLRSLGLGVSYQFSRYASIRSAYGWQLKYLDRSTEHDHAHIAVNLSW